MSVCSLLIFCLLNYLSFLDFFSNASQLIDVVILVFKVLFEELPPDFLYILINKCKGCMKQIIEDK